MAAPNAPSDQDETLFSKALKIIAYPVSAFTGYSVAKPMIRDATYDNLKDYGAFQDFRPQHVEELKSIVERFQRHQPVDVLGETRKAHEAYAERLTGRFEGLKLGGVVDQWNFIHKTQRHNALLNGVAAAGVSLGVLLTVANSKTFARIFDMDDGPQDQSR